MKKIIKGLFNLIKNIILAPWRFLKRLIAKKQKARVEPLERLNSLLGALKTQNMLERSKIDYVETLNDYSLSFSVGKEPKKDKAQQEKKKSAKKEDASSTK